MLVYLGWIAAAFMAGILFAGWMKGRRPSLQAPKFRNCVRHEHRKTPLSVLVSHWKSGVNAYRTWQVITFPCLRVFDNIFRTFELNFQSLKGSKTLDL